MFDLAGSASTAEPGPGEAAESIVIAVPRRWYGPGGDLLAGVARAGLLLVAERVAAELGLRLHHARWTITRDPRAIREIVKRGDCVSCLAGADQALAFLAGHPDREVAAGALQWAARDQQGTTP
jgi:hypothetical protein